MAPWQSLLTGSLALTLIILAASCLFTVATLAGTLFLIYFIRKQVGANRAQWSAAYAAPGGFPAAAYPPAAAGAPAGVPASATVQQVVQTGAGANGAVLVSLRLEAHPPGGAPFVTQLSVEVPALSLAQLQPGAVVPVTISATDPTQVQLAGTSMGQPSHAYPHHVHHHHHI